MPTLATVTDCRQIRPEAYWIGLTRTLYEGREVGIGAASVAYAQGSSAMLELQRSPRALYRTPFRPASILKSL